MNNLLQSKSWFTTLQQSFNCNSKIIEGKEPLAITIFNLYGAKIAYINFPIGLNRKLLTREVLAIKNLGADIIRTTYTYDSCLKAESPANSVMLPETIIPDLAVWSYEKLNKSLRYKLRRCTKKGLVVRNATSRDGQLLYKLYQNTVNHHQGNIKYSLNYFESLCELAEYNDELVILISEYQDIGCGFVAGFKDKSQAFYLHGGTNRHYSSLRPGYIAMFEFLQTMKNKNALSCNMLTSPIEQKALVKFKESWLGNTHLKVHLDIPVSIVGSLYLYLLKYIPYRYIAKIFTKSNKANAAN